MPVTGFEEPEWRECVKDFSRRQVLPAEPGQKPPVMALYRGSQPHGKIKGAGGRGGGAHEFAQNTTKRVWQNKNACERKRKGRKTTFL